MLPALSVSAGWVQASFLPYTDTRTVPVLCTLSLISYVQLQAAGCHPCISRLSAPSVLAYRAHQDLDRSVYSDNSEFSLLRLSCFLLCFSASPALARALRGRGSSSPAPASELHRRLVGRVHGCAVLRFASAVRVVLRFLRGLCVASEYYGVVLKWDVADFGDRPGDRGA